MLTMTTEEARKAMVALAALNLPATEEKQFLAAILQAVEDHYGYGVISCRFGTYSRLSTRELGPAEEGSMEGVK